MRLRGGGWAWVALLAAAAGAGALAWWSRPEVPPAPPSPSPSRAAPADVLAPQARLIFRAFYPQCGREQVSVQPAGPELAGLTPSDLAARFPEWQLTSFAPQRAEFFRTVAGPCPGSSEEEWFTVVLRQGRVVVLRGRGPDGPVYLTTRISDLHLTPEERELLQRGLPVEGRENLLHLLESLEEAGPEE